MNLRKLIFWNDRAASLAATDGKSGIPETRPGTTTLDGTESNGRVVHLPPRTREGASTSGAPTDDGPTPVSASTNRFTGAIDAPELVAFFEDNHFGLGRHSGAVYRTRESLDLGIQALSAKFQNTLVGLIQRRQSKINRLRIELIEIEGVSLTMSDQLRLAAEQLQREIEVLREQIDLAGEGKGWVLEATNRYRIGFGKGLRSAIDFELLGA